MGLQFQPDINFISPSPRNNKSLLNFDTESYDDNHKLVAPGHDHYANMSVQYIAIFHGCKNDNFQMKILIFFLFLLKT